MKISLRRAAAVCALAMPLALGTSGIAMADAYDAFDATAGPHGAVADVVHAGTGYGHGGYHGAFFEDHSVAGPDGASSEWTFATVGDDGEVTYVTVLDTAGPDGASSSFEASAGSHGW
ncbi:hypothetical protein ACFFQW_18930 [Umezawaea endophytica]|uniref:Uncharacterized protein n=1 Tax=Umezawaea endophytica TaxID=1654476 RepID=A0A9X2VPD0_9PSEU|nr:hypothetical protein [Umezawaea endophytica]MCS7479859.1 hypothetical protein [Umezawaea endophytica]